MDRIIRIFSTPQALAESLAIDLVNQIMQANKGDLPFIIALSGGSTPKQFFTFLGEKFANPEIWHHVHFFWVDERCVSPEDPESNFGMTNEIFLSRIDIPQENIHRIRGEGDPDIESKRYSNEIKDITVQKGGLPFFNIILLGLGEDGHTASLFPGNERLFMADNVCEAVIHPSTGQGRITITGKVINNAAIIIFLVTGQNKAEIVNNIIGQGSNKKQFPASYVKPDDGKIFWYLDEAAGSLLKRVRG
jgi:6-phosphogluconolactonase